MLTQNNLVCSSKWLKPATMAQASSNLTLLQAMCIVTHEQFKFVGLGLQLPPCVGTWNMRHRNLSGVQTLFVALFSQLSAMQVS